MGLKRFDREGSQVVIHADGDLCGSQAALVRSEVFRKIVGMYLAKLRAQDSPVIEALPIDTSGEDGEALLIRLLERLSAEPLDLAARNLPDARDFQDALTRRALHEFVEGLYDFWRGFDRFVVLHSEPGPSSFERRPYRAFNTTVEELTPLIRALYRDICENITDDHPRIYRQVAAGCDVGVIAVPRQANLAATYQETLGVVPFIRQVWITPPMIIDPPANTRSGQFRKVNRNPIEGLSLSRDEWLCYPARVGPLTVFIYFHERFIGLGCSLANLFELASDEQIAAGPDAIHVFGAPAGALESFGEPPTVFFDDEAAGLIVAAIPNEDRFGYFGYLKKMTLTLHNVVMMRRGRMPYHGAMVRIALKGGHAATVLIVGDTATGKSESLEAFRALGEEFLRDMRVVADDMGSLEVDEKGRVLGYGTETGAFIRLDDLQQGYAFGQMDRAIFMSPQKVNARVVLPVTTIDEVLHGYPVDVLLYANNYEQVDETHPILSRFTTAEQALEVFREGAAMSKGTTSATGLVHSYFANVFGPPQYRELHDGLAARTFEAAFGSGVWVGQLRTRLGIPGCEASGPRDAARALLDLIRAGLQSG
jgi:hypothetical protein